MKIHKHIAAFILGAILGGALPALATNFAATGLVRYHAKDFGDGYSEWAYGQVGIVASVGLDESTTVSSSGAETVLSVDSTYINDLIESSSPHHIEQVGLTDSDYGALTGAINGSNRAFDTSTNYDPATLVVYYSGVVQSVCDTGCNVSVTDANTFTFDSSIVPSSGAGDYIIAEYDEL